MHVTLVPVLSAVGEPKTKPTQHSVKELRTTGLQPDIIVARTEAGHLPDEHKQKIALYCSVEERLSSLPSTWTHSMNAPWY